MEQLAGRHGIGHMINEDREGDEATPAPTMDPPVSTSTPAPSASVPAVSARSEMSSTSASFITATQVAPQQLSLEAMQGQLENVRQEMRQEMSQLREFLTTLLSPQAPQAPPLVQPQPDPSPAGKETGMVQSRIHLLPEEVRPGPSGLVLSKKLQREDESLVKIKKPRVTNTRYKQEETERRKIKQVPQDHVAVKVTEDASVSVGEQYEQNTCKEDEHDGEDQEQSDETYIDIDRGVITAKRQKAEQQQEPAEEPSEPFYYPMQESLAELIVGRIEDILHIYHEKRLSDFKKFDFQIYTAAFNNLGQQTLFRLTDPLACCFQTYMYHREAPEILKLEAEKRVHKYLKSRDVELRFDELIARAAAEPDTFFLIVADEAHWGRGPKQESGDKDENVFVLLVTATGFNLKTEESRLDTEQLAARIKRCENLKKQSKSGSKQVMMKNVALSHPEEESVHLITKEPHGIHYRYTRSGERVEDHMQKDKVYPLHHIRWAEGHESRITNGIVLKLRVIVGSDETRWLVLGKEDERGFCHLRATHIPENAVEFFMMGRSTDHVTIKVIARNGECEYQLLSLKDVQSQAKELYVWHTQRPLPNKYKVSKDFKVHLDCGEGVLLLQVVDDNSGFLLYDQQKDTVALGRKPEEDSEIKSPMPLYPLKYSFLVDYTRETTDMRIPKQYLSLNFYFNTMRNSSIDEQLLRCDDEFSNMLDVLCNKQKKVQSRTKDDYLAADYAYYILLIGEMRNARLHSLSLGDILTNPGKALGDYTEKREHQLKRFSKKLDEADKDGKPTCSSKILSELLENLQSRREEQLDTALKQHKIPLGDLVEALISGLFHLDVKRLTAKFSAMRKKLGIKLLELDREFIQKYVHGDQFDALKMKCLETSETFKIINQVVKDVPQTGIDGKMVVVRVQGLSSGEEKETAPGNRFYNTLCYARSVSTRKKFTFEVIRDFDTFKISDIMEGEVDTPKYRMHSRLQPRVCEYKDASTLRACTGGTLSTPCDNYEAVLPPLRCNKCGHLHRKATENDDDPEQPDVCEYVDPRSGEACQIEDGFPCKLYDPEQSSLKCTNCKHYHRKIKDYSDCNKLPCILILVKKGRLGDTFPESFSAIDLRISFDKTDPYLTTLMQELGRLCRYTEIPQECTGRDNSNEYRRLPYALISSSLRDLLEKGLKKYAILCGIFAEKDLLDRYITTGKQGKKTQKRKSKEDGSGVSGDAGGFLASKKCADFGNNMKHHNRLLLEAEPQIGKTGVYLKTISILRQKISPDVHEEDEESEHDPMSEDEDEDVIFSTGTNRAKHTTKQFEEDDERWQYPYWKDMRDMCYPKYVNDGKYKFTKGSKICKNNTPSRPAAPQLAQQNVKKIKPCLPICFRTYAYNDPAHVSCTLCNSYTNSVLITERDFGVKISVPYKRRYLEVLRKLMNEDVNVLDHFSFKTCNSFSMTHSQEDMTAVKLTPPEQTLESWIFIPSYRRPTSAAVNYRHTMVQGDDNQECYYVQILVVREEEFNAYHSLWGSTHAIIQLPHRIENCDATVENGIGYARLFVQKFAENYGLPYIFMLDDNIRCMREVVTEKKGEMDVLVREDQILRMQEVPLFCVLKHLESQFLNPRPPTRLHYERCPDERCKAEELYTGPADQYAALGCLKERKGTGSAVHPHKKTYLYSLVLLNVNLLKKKGIQYQPTESMEDVELYKECRSKKLWLCKYNRFAMRKLNLISEIIQPLYYWQDTDTLPEKCPKSKEVNDDLLFRGIQRKHPPSRTEERPSRGTASAICMRFREVQDGSAHLLIYTGEHGKLNKELENYFCNTKGIGGYSEHLVMFDTKLCRAGNLKTRSDFKSCVVDLLFDDVQEYEVFTSHQIQDFAVPHVVVLIKGRIRNPCDREEEPNTPEDIIFDTKTMQKSSTSRDTKRSPSHSDKSTDDGMAPFPPKRKKIFYKHNWPGSPSSAEFENESGSVLPSKRPDISSQSLGPAKKRQNLTSASHLRLATERQNQSSASQQRSAKERQNPSSASQQGPGTERQNQPPLTLQRGVTEQQNPSSASQQRSAKERQNPSSASQQGPGTERQNQPPLSQQGPGTKRQNPSSASQQGSGTERQNPSSDSQQGPATGRQNPSSVSQQRSATERQNEPSVSQQRPATERQYLPSFSQQGPATERRNQPPLTLQRGVTEQQNSSSASQQRSATEQKNPSSASQQRSATERQNPSSASQQRSATERHNLSSASQQGPATERQNQPPLILQRGATERQNPSSASQQRSATDRQNTDSQQFIMVRLPSIHTEVPWAGTGTPTYPIRPDSSRAPGDAVHNEADSSSTTTSNQRGPGSTAAPFNQTRRLQLDDFEVFSTRTRESRPLLPDMKLRKTDHITLKLDASESRVDGKSLADLLRENNIKS